MKAVSLACIIVGIVLNQNAGGSGLFILIAFAEVIGGLLYFIIGLRMPVLTRIKHTFSSKEYKLERFIALSDFWASSLNL